LPLFAPDPATDATAQTLAVIIPASNEAGYIGRCLAALLAQDQAAGRVLVILAANACRDATVSIAEGFAPAMVARGWRLVIDDSPVPGKLGALNRADALVNDLVGGAAIRAYLDADVVCDPALLGQIRASLSGPAPAYATGTLAVARAKSLITRAYADLWTRLPFVQGGAVGAGFFAVNAAGRARWGAFPDIISDDTFVRLNFAPAERHEVPARYHWPMVEGWANLIRVRRRQDAGVAEVYRLYPELRANEGKGAVGQGGLLPLARAAPLGFVVYSLVRLAVRLRPAGKGWSRGR
jgi:glycosyltransferase involved in cell wall biosynthesis